MSLLPDLRTIGDGGDGADRDQLEGDVSHLTLPRPYGRPLLRFPLVGVDSDEGAGVGRRVVVGSSLLSDLRTIDSGGDGANRDQLCGYVSQLTLSRP